jgi:hypothetical protein
MKKKMIILGLFAICIASLFFYLNFKKNIVYKIEYEYVGDIELPLDSIDREYSLFYKLSSMKKVLMNEFEYDVGRDSLIQSLDFDKYDYIITFHKKAINIEYDLEYANKYDHCNYIIGLEPIKVSYSNFEFNHKLFIYKIFEKNKYRHLCP